MFIDFAARQPFGAPAERNVMVDEHVEWDISLRWSEELYGSRSSINIRSPPGLSDLVKNRCQKIRNLRTYRTENKKTAQRQM